MLSVGRLYGVTRLLVGRLTSRLHASKLRKPLEELLAMTVFGIRPELASNLG